MQFTALENFECPETQSTYVKGISYTVRSFESYDPRAWGENKVLGDRVKTRCEALAKLVPQWVTAGKAQYGVVENAGQVKGD